MPPPDSHLGIASLVQRENALRADLLDRDQRGVGLSNRRIRGAQFHELIDIFSEACRIETQVQRLRALLAVDILSPALHELRALAASSASSALQDLLPAVLELQDGLRSPATLDELHIGRQLASYRDKWPRPSHPPNPTSSATPVHDQQSHEPQNPDWIAGWQSVLDQIAEAHTLIDSPKPLRSPVSSRAPRAPSPGSTQILPLAPNNVPGTTHTIPLDFDPNAHDEDGLTLQDLHRREAALAAHAKAAQAVSHHFADEASRLRERMDWIRHQLERLLDQALAEARLLEREEDYGQLEELLAVFACLPKAIHQPEQVDFNAIRGALAHYQAKYHPEDTRYADIIPMSQVDLLAAWDAAHDVPDDPEELGAPRY